MEQGQKSIFKSKIFWFSLLGGLLIIGGIAYALLNTGGEDTPETPPETPPTTPPAVPPSTPPTTPPTAPPSTLPSQTLGTYTCETKKVCQGRTGYQNWVKTGDKDKCNKKIPACLWDCLGTCSTWE